MLILGLKGNQFVISLAENQSYCLYIQGIVCIYKGTSSWTSVELAILPQNLVT